MLDSARHIVHDIAKAGESFLGAKHAFQSAYRTATQGPKPELSVRPK